MITRCKTLSNLWEFEPYVKRVLDRVCWDLSQTSPRLKDLVLKRRKDSRTPPPIERFQLGTAFLFKPFVQGFLGFGIWDLGVGIWGLGERQTSSMGVSQYSPYAGRTNRGKIWKLSFSFAIFVPYSRICAGEIEKRKTTMDGDIVAGEKDKPLAYMLFGFIAAGKTTFAIYQRSSIRFFVGKV